MILKFKKYLKSIVAAIFLSFVFSYFYSNDDEENQNIIFDVIKSDIQKNISASGTLQASEQVSIGAQVSGQIKNILVSEGESVKKGDLLAIIDPQLAQAELNLAKAEMENAQANLDTKFILLRQYEADFNRYNKLIKKQATTQKTLDEARARLDITKAEIRSAKSNLNSAIIRVERAQTQLSYTEIRSPIDGTVVSIPVKIGQTLATIQQVPILMTLANIDTMKVNVKISEADVAHIPSGAPISFTLLGDPDQKFHAKLESIKLIPTHTNEQTENANNAIYYYATFKIPNPEHKLRISMSAFVTITLDKRINVLTIPLSALRKKISLNEYVVTKERENGEKEQIVIKTGLRNDSHIEVISGLSAQDKVILPITPLSSNEKDIYNIL
ncbi:efflux RND transporter periplasmic adaptor subunit [Pasteurella oralis]|uniref:efflux RND transporter periplasmic adaptor subunit n=1 Tax=Pasteurella oralis TaxID=1071947 RepID=UPI00142E37D4|nr:efflux RND transporter periplasmic adaptor subunit [Pasteurella oralis]